MKKQATTTETFIDPVCLMKVDPGNKNFTTMYQMRSYYFCAEACRKAFEVDPEKYLKAKAPKRKGWWRRYLDRLEKTTGGRPPQCH
jgi:YHS domain-containing protein